jgi:acyl carrier protein
MTTNEIQSLLDFVKTLASERADIEIEPDTRLFETSVLNSMNILDLIGYVEGRIGRKLTDDELVMSHFGSVRSIVTTFFQ